MVMHRRIQRLTLSFVLAATPCALPAQVTSGRQADLTEKADCGSLLPGSAHATKPHRSITAQDLVVLRDIGSIYSDPRAESGLSISPDGKRAAFVMRQANAASNSYCIGLFSLTIENDEHPVQLDAGGDLITAELHGLRGLTFPSGIPQTMPPKWSPDGQWIAYLKRVDGRTMPVLVRADGSSARSIDMLRDDVEDIGWMPDGMAIVIAIRPAIAAKREAIEAAGRQGYLYGTGIWPIAGAKPWPEGDTPLAYVHFDLTTMATRDATPAESALLKNNADPRLPKEVDAVSKSGANLAWFAPQNPDVYPSPERLWVVEGAGKPLLCEDAACTDHLVGLWWPANDAHLYFLKKEGPARSLFGLYRWRPGEKPRRILSTKDVLVGCVLAGNALLCGHEDATHPRRIARVDLGTGKIHLRFDPNPEFSALALGKVERLHWTNPNGSLSFGDLVYPVSYESGKRYPLIVVQYRTQGFLRGGIGDEYPIQLLASRGYAVLSFDRPPFYYFSTGKTWADWHGSEAENIHGWADRRMVQASLETGVRSLIARGIADPKRLGITGLSDGAATAWFSLINSNLFSAAAISSCCQDPKTYTELAGPAWLKDLRSYGFPDFSEDDPDFWRPMSVAMNASHIDAPILMQLADDSYMLGLEAYNSLRSYKKPTEMYVFPDDHHIKWQPSHRLAIYDRSVDWFDFWLMGKEDAAPSKQAQYARWRQLKSDADRSSKAGANH
jgi:dipeptidyl aminopeptidase/acylaminoacyl peptidase